MHLVFLLNLFALAVAPAVAQTYRAVSPGAIVMTVESVDERSVKSGDVIDDALLVELTTSVPNGPPTLSARSTRFRVAQGLVVVVLAGAEMYVRLPASDAQTDYTSLIDIDGGFKMTRGLRFRGQGGDPPKIRTNAHAILVPVFPSQKGSSFVKATGTHEFVFMPPPARESLRPLFFAPGATHTLRLQDGEMIEWNGITRRASGMVEVKFSIDPSGKLQSAVKKGKLAQL